MDIKKLTDQIRSELPDEIKSKVGSFLKEIENGFENLIDDVKSVTKESIDRKNKLRDKDKLLEDLNIQISEKDNQIKKLDETPLKQKVAELETKNKSFIQSQRSGFVKKFEQIKENPKFEKVKGKFKLPKEENGKANWDEIKDEEMEVNINTINDLFDIGYFDDDKSTSSPDKNKGGGDIKDFYQKLAQEKDPRKRDEMIYNYNKK